MNKITKTAVGGMVTALSVALMFMTVLPFLEYTFPAVAGLILIIVVINMGSKWAMLVFAAVGTISLLLIPEKQAAVMYITFFGYYPILREGLLAKIKSKWVVYLIKFAVFNAAMIASYFIIIKVFGIPIETLKKFGSYAPWLLLFFGNAVFVSYDICLKQIIAIYRYVWNDRLKRLLRF